MTGGPGHRGTGAPAIAALLLACAGALQAQTWRTVTSSRQLRGEDALAVELSYAAGRLHVAPGTPATLYRMELRYDEESFAPVREFDAAAGTLRLGVRSLGRERGMRVSLGDRRRGEEPSTLDVTLTPAIPLDLTVRLGAAEAEVELGGLSIRSLSYRTGASQSRLSFGAPNPLACESMRLEAGAASFHVTGLANANCRRLEVNGGMGEVVLDFTGSWQGPLDASVRLSIGELTVRVPRDVGIAIRLSRFLASFEEAGFVKRGGVFYSSNFDRARHRLQLDVNAAIGGINVVRVD